MAKFKFDDSKVKAIQTRPIPKSTHDVQSFHGLASFYKQFIKNFSIIMAPMIEVIKGTLFRWTPKVQIALEELKDKQTRALVLALSCFEKSLELSATHLVLA